jgi:SNF2 family DNA or RNA helicase
MALKLDVVRLLVADDVGVGKTIEAALIARELVDRGDIDRFTVLCPPHLVDQWTTELHRASTSAAVPVTAHGAAKLERALPVATASSRPPLHRRQPRLHQERPAPRRVPPRLPRASCSSTRPTPARAQAAGQQKRFELLSDLAAPKKRHLVLLTATPHSGDEGAFYRLLGLLDPDVRRAPGRRRRDQERLRERLARHFVQRRRPDIAEWKEGELFPKRETTEVTYKLTGAWERFFGDVLDYCAAVVAAADGDARRQRLNFWGTLALMRCVASPRRRAPRPAHPRRARPPTPATTR